MSKIRTETVTYFSDCEYGGFHNDMIEALGIAPFDWHSGPYYEENKCSSILHISESFDVIVYDTLIDLTRKGSETPLYTLSAKEIADDDMDTVAVAQKIHYVIDMIEELEANNE